jgi:hypothetical protein
VAAKKSAEIAVIAVIGRDRELVPIKGCGRQLS